MASDGGFDIATVGPPTHDSPLLGLRPAPGGTFAFVEDDDRVLVDHRLTDLRKHSGGIEDIPAFERAGARRKIFFKPEETRMGIVTCGGLCPGTNNVIRDIVMAATYQYGVRRIVGFRYGYRGLVDKELRVELTPKSVKEIHELGGTVLGTSRGPQSVEAMVDTLEELGIDVLFAIGGDGTTRGALAISGEIRRRELKTAVIVVPKTIDNDFKFMDESFGYVTAYSKALEAIDSAHREAQAALNGIGLVKLMGRHSGFIACAATLASNQVNFTLIPEVPFKLEGKNGFLDALKARLEYRDHAVVVVAEGAGQGYLKGSSEDRDASGNVVLEDIGPFLAGRIREYFKAAGMEITLKYIDPSYIIRSIKASAPDSVLCTDLAINAVHAAMSGRTEMVIARWHNDLVHVPMRQAISERNTVDPAGPLWLSVLGTTGQPPSFS
jgi:6-phosphofructokinase 1